MKNIQISFIILILFFLIACTYQNSNPTFSNDIAPIIYKHCTSCHRPKQIGHFNLVTYNDVLVNADKITYCVKNNTMPPWPANNSYVSFANENVLSSKEKQTIETWIKNKCPIGDSNAIPQVPTYYNSLLGKPDTTIAVIAQKIKGNYKDKFLLVKVPFQLPEEKYIQTIEFVPGNTSVVHHVNGDMVLYDFEKKKNIMDGSFYSDMKNDSTIKLCYKKIGLLHDDGSYPTLKRSVVNYLPGSVASRYPEGIGGIKAARKNAFVLNDIHYGPSADDTWDSSYINIFYAKKTPERIVQEFQLGTLGVSPIVPPLILPANTIRSYRSTYTITQKISVLTLNPHMHLLGKKFIAYALTPTNDTIRLIHIPKWDFNWQYFYTYKKPVIIPACSTIHMEGEFDNTEKNEFNPNHPPKEVRDNNGSMRTTDEMFQLIISYLDYKEGDENINLEK